MNHEFSDELLSAYLDDELSPEERASVDEALEADPELRRTCDELRALSNTLQAMPSSQPTSDWSEAVLQRATAVNPAQVAPTLSRRSGSNLRAWSLVAGTLATIAATVLVVVNLSRQPSDDQTRDVAQATVAQEAGNTADDAVFEASAEGDGSAAGADAMPIEFAADAESPTIHTNAPADQPASLDKVVPAIPSPAANKRQELADKQPMADDGSRANRSNASSRTQPDAGTHRGADARIKSSQATFSNRPQAVKLVLRRGEDSRAALARLLQLSAAELSQLRADDRKMVKSVASATGDQDDNASDDRASAESKEKSHGLREKYEQLVLATLTPEQLAEADEVFVLPSRPGIFQQAELLKSRQQEQSATSPASTADAFNSNSEPGSPESAQPKEHQTKAGQPKGTGTGVRSPSAPTPASPQNPAPPRPLADDKDAEAAITEAAAKDADDSQSDAQLDAASLRPAANAMRKRTAQQVFRVVPKELLAKSKTLIEHESAPEPAPEKPTSTDAQPLRKAPMAIAHQPLIVIVQYEDDPETEKNLAAEPTNE